MITPEEVDNLVALARLEVSANEKEKLIKDLEAILAYVSELKSAPVTKTELSGAQYLPTNVFRPDTDPYPTNTGEGSWVKVKKIL